VSKGLPVTPFEINHLRETAFRDLPVLQAMPSLTLPIPVLWQVVRLGDVCNLVTSCSRGWAELYAKSGPKFLRGQNIRFGRFRLDELACVDRLGNCY